MNKQQFLEEIKKHSGLSAKHAGLALNAFVASVASALKSGKKLTLVGFGSFMPVKRKARIGRNPKTGKEIKIPATIAAKFRAGKRLKDVMSGKASLKSHKAKAKPKKAMKKAK
jgi:DNA-binding protein HU-beta